MDIQSSHNIRTFESSADYNQKILIIDDDVSLQELCIAALSRIGYQCVSAYTGEAGLEKILEEQPSLILLDNKMPGINGQIVFERLITQSEYKDCKDTPVIMLTGMSGEENLKNELFSKGIAAYLNKPFGINELINVIQNVLISHQIKIHTLSLQEEISRSKRYLELIIDHTPHGIMVVDLSGNILRLNSFFANMLGLNQTSKIVGQSIFTVLETRRPELSTLFQNVINTKKASSIPVIEVNSSTGEAFNLNIKCIPMREESGEITGILSIWEDVTQTEKREYELSILRQISEAMQSVLDLDILLHLILTSITAGCALGFSRSIIFLINEKTNVLEGRMGVGPNSENEAHQIWDELVKDHENLRDFLRKFGLTSPSLDDPFNNEVLKLKISLTNEKDVLVSCLHNKKSVWIRNQDQIHAEDLFVDESFLRFFKPLEFVTVPLIANNKTLGVVIADNKFSGVNLRKDRIDLLELLANQAGLAIESAESYHRLEEKVQELAETLKQLQETQDKLVRSEKLATIGNMATHVAHEIRNPLTAIGGFANAIMKTPTDVENVELGSKIIKKEVQRLENILGNVLDFTKISKPKKQKSNLNSVIEEILILQNTIIDENINLTADLSPLISEFYFDEEQIKQALVNIITNSISSIKSTGMVQIKTLQMDSEIILEVADTGVGMADETLENIFNPFYTTRRDGTGLGLAVTERIVEEHGGRIEVNSKPDKGTVFKIILPIIQEEMLMDQSY